MKSANFVAVDIEPCEAVNRTAFEGLIRKLAYDKGEGTTNDYLRNYERVNRENPEGVYILQGVSKTDEFKVYGYIFGEWKTLRREESFSIFCFYVYPQFRKCGVAKHMHNALISGLQRRFNCTSYSLVVSLKSCLQACESMYVGLGYQSSRVRNTSTHDTMFLFKQVSE
jgi:hypothetical protein